MLSNKSGFTLITVMVGSVLLILLVFMTSQMMNSSSKREASLEAGGQLQDQMQTLKSALSSQQGCTSNFLNKIVDVTVIDFQSTDDFKPENMILSSYRPDGTVQAPIIKVGDKLGPLRISQIKVKLDGKLGSAYLGTLYVIGEAEKEGRPYQQTLHLIFEANPTGTATPNLYSITSCKISPKGS